MDKETGQEEQHEVFTDYPPLRLLESGHPLINRVNQAVGPYVQFGGLVWVPVALVLALVLFCFEDQLKQWLPQLLLEFLIVLFLPLVGVLWAIKTKLDWLIGSNGHDRRRALDYISLQLGTILLYNSFIVVGMMALFQGVGEMVSPICKGALVIEGGLGILLIVQQILFLRRSTSLDEQKLQLEIVRMQAENLVVERALVRFIVSMQQNESVQIPDGLREQGLNDLRAIAGMQDKRLERMNKAIEEQM